jgi:hypothetical protein
VIDVSVHAASNVRSKIGQNKADVVGFGGIPLNMLNSSLVSSEQPNRRSEFDRRLERSGFHAV